MSTNSGSTAIKTGGMDTKRMVTLAVLAAMSYLLMVVGRVSFMPAAEYLKYDPKDIIIVISGFLYGPLSAVLISVVVSFVEMITVSSTGPIGLVMNIVSTCAFALPAAYLYKKRGSVKGAYLGLILSVLLQTTVMLLWNYLLVPLYTPYITREAVMGMLVPVFLPFNIVKGGLNAAFAMLLYKPIVTALRKSRLVPLSEKASGAKGVFKWGPVLAASFVLITFVLIALALAGKI